MTAIFSACTSALDSGSCCNTDLWSPMHMQRAVATLARWLVLEVSRILIYVIELTECYVQEFEVSSLFVLASVPNADDLGICYGMRQRPCSSVAKRRNICLPVHAFSHGIIWRSHLCSTSHRQHRSRERFLSSSPEIEQSIGRTHGKHGSTALNLATTEKNK